MPLIADELQKINDEIKAGEERLKWKSEGVDEYIVNIRNKVSYNQYKQTIKEVVQNRAMRARVVVAL